MPDPRPTSSIFNSFIPLKRRADRLAEIYTHAGMTDEARKLNLCADQIVVDENTGRIVYVMYCRNKLCPLTTNAVKYRNIADMRKLLEYMDFDSYSYHMLTLTVPNVPADALADEARNLDRAWTKFTSYADVVKVVHGWQKALEIDFNTRGDIIMYQPHIHAIIAVNKSYAPSYRWYLTQNRITELWSNATGRFISPSHGVNDRKIEPDDGKSEFETFLSYVKYISKGSFTGKRHGTIDALLNEVPEDKAAEIVRTVTPILRGRWNATYGGVMKEARLSARLPDDSENNIDIDNIGGNAVSRMMLVTYVYDPEMREYVKRYSEAD